jgi:hypothetical protein
VVVVTETVLDGKNYREEIGKLKGQNLAIEKQRGMTVLKNEGHWLIST